MTATSELTQHSTISNSLLEICSAMNSALELQDLLALILDLSMGELQSQQGSILLYDEMTDNLKMLAAVGLPRDVLQRGYVPRKGSIAEYVMENCKPLLLNDDVKHDARFTSIAQNRPIKSSMCVPLIVRDKPIGTLNLTRTLGTNFEEYELETCMILASQAAVCIERARLHEQALQAERLAAVGQTVAGISHCIKNILTGLKGGGAICNLGIEKRDWSLAEKGYLTSKKNIDRISLLVLDMLDYAKERKPVRQKASFGQIVEDVFDSVRLRDAEAQVEFVYTSGAEQDVLFADKDQLFRCLLNLVGNAFDALEDQSRGRIEVRFDVIEQGDEQHPGLWLSNQEQTTCIRIIDNGCGIEAEHLQKIFQPFFSSKGTKGTGLGLPVTKKIIEEHGGELRVNSVKNEGTTFVILLPTQLADEELLLLDSKSGAAQ